MDTSKTSIEKVQDENAPIAAGEDKIDAQQLNAMPAPNALLPLCPDAAGGGNMSTSANPANPADPIISIRIQRPGATPDELDDEALELTQILRDFIFKTSEVMGILAGHPEIIAPFQYDLSMVDATSAFLASMMGPGTCGSSARPLTEDQALRQMEIRNRCYRTIHQMRRIPGEQQQVDYSGQDSSASVQEVQTPDFKPRQSIEIRRGDTLAHNLSRVLKFQLDGTGQEDSGSTQQDQDQDQLEAIGSDQGGSCPSQGN
ncbi:hypothetical protein SLS64_008629 [Diaporthe eres]